MLVHFCNAAAAKETAPLAIAIAAADTAGSNACASGAAETATTDIGLALLSRPRSAAGLIARSRIRDCFGDVAREYSRSVARQGREDRGLCPWPRVAVHDEWRMALLEGLDRRFSQRARLVVDV